MIITEKIQSLKILLPCIIPGFQISRHALQMSTQAGNVFLACSWSAMLHFPLLYHIFLCLRGERIEIFVKTYEALVLQGRGGKNYMNLNSSLGRGK